MSNDEQWTLHANVNSHGRDKALRVTWDCYDVDIHGGEPITWRGHAVMPRFDRPIDQAWVALVQLCKLLESQGALGRVTGVYDIPLWDDRT
jgi:hypothetical protein